jgi:Carboxypeptidase regulatory-like domain
MKHRRPILLGFVLLVGGILLLGRQWTSTPNPVHEPASISTRLLAQPQPEKVEAATVEAAALSASAPPSAPPPATATGFRGRIIDAVTRQPVKEFDVQLIRIRREAYTEDEPITRHFKSATGNFLWADVAAGTWRAAVTAPGYQLFNLEDLQISDGKATREIVMPLLRGLTVRGRVFELSTGAGVADAWISFRPVGTSDRTLGSRLVAKSKDDGSFTLDGVPGGDVVLTVGAQDHAYRELEITVDEKTPPQEVALSTGGTIAGTVTTTSGVPVKGSLYLQGPGPGYFGETNEAGQFSYKHMPAGRYRVSADTSAGSARQEFVLHQDEIKESIALVVGVGRSIRGIVKGLRPEQVQETHLLLQAESENVSFSARPDERGAYAMNGVPPGRAVMRVLGPSLEFEKPVDVPADQDVTLDIAFPTGARLSGRVTQGGKPAANKNVWLGPVEDKSGTLYRATTSEDGQYEIEGLPPGEYRLRAAEDINRAITMAGDAVLNIDIPSAQLSARVVEDGGIVPIVGANVYLRGTASETARVRGDKQTDDFGQFALTGIEPGEIVLMVYKPGYEMHRETISYSSPITNKTITLRKSAGVEVRVQPGSRRFPRGFTITQSFPGNDYVVDLWMPSDREGVCRVPAALAGTTFQIGRFSGKPIVIEEWDGQPFELP